MAKEGCPAHEAQIVRVEGLTKRIEGVETSLYHPEHGLVHKMNALLSSNKTILGMILFVQPFIIWTLNKYVN